MSVRRQINRYRTEPSGYDFSEILKKGKAFFRASGEFALAPHTTKEGDIRWYATASFHCLPPFKTPQGTRFYKFDHLKKRWIEIT